MPLGEGGLLEREGERGAPLLKIRYFSAIGLSSVKMVAEVHRYAAYHNKHWRQAF